MKRLLSTIGVLMITCLLLSVRPEKAVALEQDYRVSLPPSQGVPQTIAAWGVCREVENKAVDTTYFVPTNVSLEWEAFRKSVGDDLDITEVTDGIHPIDNLINDITLGECTVFWEVGPCLPCDAAPFWGPCGACSAACDGGICQRQCLNTDGFVRCTVVCKLDTGEIVDDSYCDGIPKPSEAEPCTLACVGDEWIACNVQPCCTSNHHTSCHNGDLWWYDSCDNPQVLKTLCFECAEGTSSCLTYNRWNIILGVNAGSWLPCNLGPVEGCWHGEWCDPPGLPSVCGRYPDGATTSYWKQGYDEPPNTIRCEQNTDGCPM